MVETARITIRPPRPDDRPEWERLFRGYVAFYKVSLSEEVIEATWQRLLVGEAGFHLCRLAVDENDRAVGLAHILFHPSTWTKTVYCYLEDLFVDPSVRAGGVGKALIEEMYREADARGASRTYWVTQEFNYRARGLYDQVASKAPFVQYRR